MADGQRGQIASVRKLVAVVLGTLATFVILFGAGMTSWSIVALGVALLVLAIGLVAVTAVGGGARAWVVGIGHVHSVSEPPASSTFGRCELQIVIDAPGLPPRSVKIRDPRVPVAKWPQPGATLPIMVAIDDQRHVRVLWDEVLTHAEAAASTNLPPEFDELDQFDDDVLIEQDEPPWARRTAEHDLPPDPGDVPEEDVSDAPSGHHEKPVVVRQAPGGTLVLEGKLVEPARPTPLPRRADTGPAAGTTDGGVTTTTANAAASTVDEFDIDIGITDPGVGGGHSGEVPRPRPADSGTASGEAGPFHRVGVTLLVADLYRSVTFYRDLLGFFEVDGGEGNAVLASGSTRLVLRAIPDVAPINRRVVHLNLEVADVEAAYEDLRAKGVRFLYGPRAVNRGAKLEQWAAAFRDPDGHGIALTQWRDRPAA